MGPLCEDAVDCSVVAARLQSWDLTMRCGVDSVKLRVLNG